VPLRAAGKYLPIQWMFYFREALTETIGLEGTGAVLRAIPASICCPAGSAKDLEKTADFSCFSSMCASVSELYGAPGARTILQRSGRTAFTRLLKRTAAMVGADRSVFSAGSAAFPLEVRMQPVIRLLGLLSDVESACVTVDGEVRFQIFSCPECSGRSAAGFLCHSMAGMVQAAVDWTDSESDATVAEVRCMAQGDSQCEFAIAGNG
jgi:predicted hydrocarbon binding protein